MDSQSHKMNGEASCSSKNCDMILDSQSINKIEHSIIKGDMVGDTLYSTQWVLKTLISISKLYEEGWNKSMENDLCLLWDMTVEKDIVNFLLTNGFLKIAEFNIRESKEPRLTEILVGIVGNMCCESTTLEALLTHNGLISEVLFLLSSDDTETVVQVLRIIHALTWHTKKKPLSEWSDKLKECEFVGDAVVFILNSSTNDDLLTSAMDLVYLISELSMETNDKFLDAVFKIDELISAMGEAMLEFFTHGHPPQSEFYLKNVEGWANTMFNIMKKELLRFDDEEQDPNFLKIIEVLKAALKPYESPSNVFPLELKAALCIQQCIEVAFWFQKNQMTPQIELVQITVSIMKNLKMEKDSEQDCDSFVADLLKFIKSYWIATIKVLSIDQILGILENYDHQGIKAISEESSFESMDLKTNIDQLLQNKLKL